MAYVHYMLGRNVSFAVHPITIDTAGTVTVGTGIAMTGKAARCEIRLIRNSEVIMALDDLLENNVPDYDSWIVNLSGIKRKVGTNPSPLEENFLAQPHAQLVVTTTLKIWTFHGLCQELAIPIERMAQIETLNLIPINTGVTNPAVVSV